jgi:hypothetical protein
MPTEHGLGCRVWRLSGQSLTTEAEVLKVASFGRRGMLSDERCRAFLVRGNKPRRVECRALWLGQPPAGERGLPPAAWGFGRKLFALLSLEVGLSRQHPHSRLIPHAPR